MRLENWAILYFGDAYTPPECITQKATGNIFDNEKFKNDEVVTTSSLKEINLQERYVITSSGSKYFLGKPKQEWIDWLHENNKKYYQIIIEDFDVKI